MYMGAIYRFQLSLLDADAALDTVEHGKPKYQNGNTYHLVSLHGTLLLWQEEQGIRETKSFLS